MLWHACAAAADSPLLDDIVVTASRVPTSMSELASDVGVIRAEAVRAAGARSLTEFLQGQPGIEITAQGGLGSQSGLFIRGANSNHTLVLLDGLRVNSASAGLTALEHIPLGQIERIEILRGPASSLYGADAIGGVVQIFTRSGSSRTGPWLEAGAGSFGAYSLTGGYARGVGDTRFALFLGRTASDGFDATRPGTWGHEPDDDGYRNNHSSLRLEHAFTREHRLELHGFLADARTEFDSSPSIDATQKQRLSTQALTSRNRFRPGWESTLRLAQSRDRLRDLSNDTRFETRQDQLQWQNDLRLTVGDLLLALERTEQEVSGSTAYTVDQRDVDAALVGYRVSLGDHAWQLNLRHDDDSQFGGHATGSFTYAYLLGPEWRLNLGYGTAFKAPTFNDLYWPVSPGYQGNPNLDPERSRQGEIGLRWQRGEHALSAHYFQNRVDDLIAYVFPTMQNVREARIEGLSLRGETRMGGWRLAASLDLQSPEDADTGKRLPRRAREHGSLTISRALGAWDLRAELIAAGTRYDDLDNTRRLDAYALVNLGADYRLGEDLRLSARLNNAFDEQYELAGGYNTPDRNFFIGLQYQPH
jgi:vitamin B12 transporter